MRFFIVLFSLVVLFSGGETVAETPPASGLPAALAAAVHNHPAIKGKLAELASQRYRIATAKSSRYPTISGEMNTQDDGNNYGNVQISQPLWAFGKIDTPIAQAKAQLRVEQLSLLQVQRQLVEQTVIAYAQLQGGQQRLRIADESIAEHQTLFKQIERRQSGQLASAADVRIAFSRLAQAESKRERIIGELQRYAAQLQALTQVEVASCEPIDKTLATLPGQPFIEEQARTKHADIRFKQEQIKVVQYNVDYEKIASMPTLYAQATRYFLDSSAADETQVGLSLEGTISGAGFGIWNRVKSAKAQVDAARQDLNSTRNDVALRIDNLLTSRSMQSRLARSQQLSVDAVLETKESYLRQYDSGRKTWLEVLNIQRELTDQKLQLAQAESDQLIYTLQILSLIGRLDSIAGIEVATE